LARLVVASSKLAQVGSLTPYCSRWSPPTDEKFDV